MRANGTRKFGQPLIRSLSEEFVQALHGEATEESAYAEVDIARLWLDDQPRQIVPEEVMERLIAEDRAKPAVLLEALRERAADDPYFAEVLAHIENLAKNVSVNGVLTPLLVAEKGNRLIVRDGHRRTLAALIAGRSSVPIRIVSEPSPIEAMAWQFVVNNEREDFGALDQARWMLRLARAIESGLRQERGLDASRSVVDALIGAAGSDAGTDDEVTGLRGASAADRDLARQVQERLCTMTGLSRRQYYNLMGLNRLTPAARSAGRTLTEAQLRPVTGLAPDDQTLVTSFIARQGLTQREATTLARVARSGDRDAVQRVMARLAKEDSGRRRVSVSWEALLHAVPKDVEPRIAALHAELHALPDDLRRARLETMREQLVLAEELVRHLSELLALFGEPESID